MVDSSPDSQPRLEEGTDRSIDSASSSSTSSPSLSTFDGDVESNGANGLQMNMISNNIHRYPNHIPNHINPFGTHSFPDSQLSTPIHIFDDISAYTLSPTIEQQQQQQLSTDELDRSLMEWISNNVGMDNQGNDTDDWMSNTLITPPFTSSTITYIPYELAPILVDQSQQSFLPESSSQQPQQGASSSTVTTTPVGTQVTDGQDPDTDNTSASPFP